jgi:hypothetical protein
VRPDAIAFLKLEAFSSAAARTVRNLANAGAMLEVVSQAAIPHEFTLALFADRSHRRCHVVWRKDKRIGVTFY